MSEKHKLIGENIRWIVIIAIIVFLIIDFGDDINRVIKPIIDYRKSHTWAMVASYVIGILFILFSFDKNKNDND